MERKDLRINYERRDMNKWRMKMRGTSSLKTVVSITIISTIQSSYGTSPSNQFSALHYY
jgi:hypothetical protein